MVFPVVGGTQDTGYEISNSLRFDSGGSNYLERTPSSAGNRRTFTTSWWNKIAVQASSRWIFGAGTESSDNDYFLFQSGHLLKFSFATESSGNIATTQVFRDPSAWQHIVWAVDTTQSTASNRVKLYVNGSQVSSFGTETYPSQNYDTSINNTVVNRIGARAYSATGHFDGYMADFHHIDGQQLAPTEFGETNDNGVWIPKQYTGSYGTNGFKLEFKQTGTSQNSSGIGADTSGNDNHFAVSNLAAIDVTEDTPTNNFATWNPLAERPGDGFITGSEGNVKATGASKHAFPTIAFPTSGKWYVEVKFTAGSSTAHLGLRDADDYSADGNTNRLYYRNDGDKDDGGTTSSYGDSWTNSIISIAVNLDDNEVTFYKDGTAQNSGTALSHDASNQYLSAGTAGSYTVEGNFGNPSFSISSGNSDANGYGNFEYAVPSGYYALCTKNLAEYG